MEVEAVDEGTLGKILVPEGTADVAVNTPIATILARRRNAVDGTVDAASKPAPQQKAAESAPPAAADAKQRRPSPRRLHPRQPLRRSRRCSPSPTCRKAPRWSP